MRDYEDLHIVDEADYFEYVAELRAAVVMV
jgi:hypothetical protein